MEEVLSRFPYIGEEIFVSLDKKSLENCKKVCRTWKNFICNPKQKFMWVENIRLHEKMCYSKLLRDHHKKHSIRKFHQWHKAKMEPSQISRFKKIFKDA